MKIKTKYYICLCGVKFFVFLLRKKSPYWLVFHLFLLLSLLKIKSRHDSLEQKVMRRMNCTNNAVCIETGLKFRLGHPYGRLPLLAPLIIHKFCKVTIESYLWCTFKHKNVYQELQHGRLSNWGAIRTNFIHGNGLANFTIRWL